MWKKYEMELKVLYYFRICVDYTPFFQDIDSSWTELCSPRNFL